MKILSVLVVLLMSLNLKAQYVGFNSPSDGQHFVLASGQSIYSVNVMIYGQPGPGSGDWAYYYYKLFTNGSGDYDTKNQHQIPQWFYLPEGTYSFRAELWVGYLTGYEEHQASKTITFYIVTPPPPPLSVYISGPSTAPCANGTWTATTSGGYPPYSYQWYHKYTSGGSAAPTSSLSSGNVKPMVPINTWIAVGSNSPSLSYYLCGGDGYLRVDVTDSHGTLVSAQYYVAGAGGGIKP